MSTQAKNHLPELTTTLSPATAIKQANILGMHDAFLVATVLAVITFILVFFLKKK